MGHLKLLRAVAITCAALVGLTQGVAAEEATTVRFAKQFGIGYLPMIIMEKMALVEKHAEQQGLGKVQVEWLQLTGGSPINDALISGQIDFAAGGVGPMVTIWAKTKGGMNVKGVGALNAMPLYLNTVSTNITSLKDFTDNDRIAMPSVKVSIQAVTLQMAAEKIFGEGKFDALDKLTVSMSHPDGMTSMMTGKSEVTAHFTSAPYMYQELNDSRVKRVLSSYDVLGGPGTFNLMWTTQAFYDKNPKMYAAVDAALAEAVEFINHNPDRAARMWAEAESSKLAPDLIRRMITDPEVKWTTTPENVMTYATFMHKVGSIKNKPDSWKDMFFPNLHDKQGS
jgi:NitT/TauT family transport system substrate-binding protein